jgi:hypothetical protein
MKSGTGRTSAKHVYQPNESQVREGLKSGITRWIIDKIIY